MLKRTLDATLLNAVSNHPEVRPGMGYGDGPLDFAPALANPDNVALVNAHGGWVFVKLGPGYYEAHSQFLPEGRTSSLVIDLREALRYLFCVTDCTEIVTRVPDDNKGALGLARAAGCREVFRRERCWPGPGGEHGVSFQSLTLDRWRGMDPTLPALGRWFHESLEAAKRAAGSELPAHEDDEAHDRAVGAAVAMIRAGNPHKAVLSYNRWACFAGYAPITLVSDHPLIFDVVDALVSLTPTGELEVLQCQVACSQR